MPSPAIVRAADEQPPIAPVWHTVALVSLIVLVALAGTLVQPQSAHAAPISTDQRIVRAYLPMLLVQWGLAVYVSRVGRRENAAPALLGRGWDGPRRAFGDVLGAFALAAVIELCEWTFAFAFGPSTGAHALLPVGGAERLVWAVVAMSTAFSEELVYRGYLRAQFVAFTGRRAAAVVIQAALFGVAHLEQGPAVAVRFAVYAVLFALLASSRRSLWPGIICHGAIDLLSGLLRT